MMRPWFTEKTGFQKRLTAADRALFQRICPPRRLSKNSCIFHAGDPAVSLHLIDAGHVKLVAPTQGGKERILAVCGPGDLLGETFLSGAPRYQASAVTATTAVTCAMSRAQFLELTGLAPYPGAGWWTVPGRPTQRRKGPLQIRPRSQVPRRASKVTSSRGACQQQATELEAT